jgi:hypothetical protein
MVCVLFFKKSYPGSPDGLLCLPCFPKMKAAEECEMTLALAVLLPLITTSAQPFCLKQSETD